MTTVTVDRAALESKVKDMYTAVAENPHGEFHFEMGRAMAERLGYLPADLNRIPSEAIDSFAGVGHFFHLAALQPGEHVVDLGSGSGMDAFVAALKVGPNGCVVGVDMTDAQLGKPASGSEKACRLQEDSKLVRRQINDAIGDDTIKCTGFEAGVAKARHLAGTRGFDTLTCRKAYIEDCGHCRGPRAAGHGRVQCRTLGGVHRRRGSAK
jgi:SAM-dependent methyltransferase